MAYSFVGQDDFPAGDNSSINGQTFSGGGGTWAVHAGAFRNGPSPTAHVQCNTLDGSGNAYASDSSHTGIAKMRVRMVFTNGHGGPMARFGFGGSGASGYQGYVNGSNFLALYKVVNEAYTLLGHSGADTGYTVSGGDFIGVETNGTSISGFTGGVGSEVVRTGPYTDSAISSGTYGLYADSTAFEGDTFYTEQEVAGSGTPPVRRRPRHSNLRR